MEGGSGRGLVAFPNPADLAAQAAEPALALLVEPANLPSRLLQGLAGPDDALLQPALLDQVADDDLLRCELLEESTLLDQVANDDLLRCELLEDLAGPDDGLAGELLEQALLEELLLEELLLEELLLEELFLEEPFSGARPSA